jgi:hypothetical protein
MSTVDIDLAIDKYIGNSFRVLVGKLKGGTIDSPSPVISLVTPIITLLIARGSRSINRDVSDCASISMKFLKIQSRIIHKLGSAPDASTKTTRSTK